MPNRFENPAVYLQSGDPEKENTPTLHAPGTLGSRFTVVTPVGQPSTGTAPGRSKRYQLVKTDSTMTVTPYPGAVAYWSDRAQYLVTTSRTNLNAVAGVFGGNQLGGSITYTSGNYMCVQFDGPAYVKLENADSAAAAIGDAVIGSSSTDAKGARVAAGTAAGYLPVGLVSSPIAKWASEARVLVDLNLPETT